MAGQLLLSLLLVASAFSTGAQEPGSGGAKPTAPAAAPDQADDPAGAPRIEIAALQELLATGGVILVDVRGDAAYRAGHIPGAVSVPLEDIGRHAAEWLERRLPVVTYCA